MTLLDQDSMEAGLLKKPLLKSHKNIIDHDDCRVTLVVIFSTFVAVLGAFISGLAVGYSSIAHSGIVRELGLSVSDYSVFGSIMTFGGMIGAIFSGKLADLLGRRNTMYFSQIFCTVGWLSIAFAKDALWLYVGRLSLGIGIGFFSYVIPVYIAEITPKNFRGAFVFANQLMQNCGISFMYICGNFIHWRTMAMICVVPCLVQVVGLYFIPESPRWLAKQGKEEFKDSLQRLRGHGANISVEENAIKDTMESFEQGAKPRILDLFQKKYAQSLIVGIGLMLLQQLSGSSGMTYYASSILEKAGFPSKLGTTTLAIIMIPKALMGLILVDRMGRRPLLLVSAIGMCFFSMLLSFSFGLQQYGYLIELTPLFTFIGLMGFITTFAMGMGGLPWILMSEIFPIDVKVSAGSLVTLANWSTSWVITYTFNFLLQWNSSATFLSFSGVSAATILFVWTLVPETKGKTLEEIQASLSHFLQ